MYFVLLYNKQHVVVQQHACVRFEKFCKHLSRFAIFQCKHVNYFMSQNVNVTQMCMLYFQQEMETENQREISKLEVEKNQLVSPFTSLNVMRSTSIIDAIKLL